MSKSEDAIASLSESGIVFLHLHPHPSCGLGGEMVSEWLWYPDLLPSV